MNIEKINKLIEENPNKYDLSPQKIRNLKIVNWDKLKEITWHNDAMKKTGDWWCHVEGVGIGYYEDYIDEFWMGFNANNDKIRFDFTCWEGMGKLTFNKFYTITNNMDKYDVEIQVKFINWVNTLIDENILSL